MFRLQKASESNRVRPLALRIRSSHQRCCRGLAAGGVAETHDRKHSADCFSSFPASCAPWLRPRGRAESTERGRVVRKRARLSRAGCGATAVCERRTFPRRRRTRRTRRRGSGSRPTRRSSNSSSNNRRRGRCAAHVPFSRRTTRTLRTGPTQRSFNPPKASPPTPTSPTSPLPSLPSPNLSKPPSSASALARPLHPSKLRNSAIAPAPPLRPAARPSASPRSNPFVPLRVSKPEAASTAPTRRGTRSRRSRPRRTRARTPSVARRREIASSPRTRR